MNAIRFVTMTGLATALLAAGPAAAQQEQTDRVREATTVLREIMDVPDQAIPDAVLTRAEAIAVFPGTLKGGFVVGAHRGSGLMSVRDRTAGTWSPPAFLTVTGGSFGAQIGVQSIDLILVVMNRRGVENLVKNQFKIGAGASVTAGPVGRSAEAGTDMNLRAEILSYSRARGLFAGVSLQGAAVNQDRDANEDFYGTPYRTRQIVLDGRIDDLGPQADVIRAWRRALQQYASGDSSTRQR